MNDAPDRAEPRHSRRRHLRRTLGVAVAAIALLLAAAVPAAAAELMRVTFVRHGESAGNASGLIDTSTPGPVLTPLGQQQARDVVGTLGDNNYDAVYASAMVRTQLTATPMSQYLRLPIQVLPGIQEIEAGVFEGTPEASASSGYGLYPLGWTFPGVIPQLPVSMFNKGTVMPGTTLDGYGFDERVKAALQTIYDNGDRNAVVFSHGGTIMFWTLMNVSNLTITQKLQLLQTAALGNTDYVVIEGNPEDGWTLVNWNGQQFAPKRTLVAEIALQVRTLTRQLAAATTQVFQAFATGDVRTILTAINRAVADAAYSVVKFNRTVTAKVVGAVTDLIAPPAPAAPEQAGFAATTAAPDEGAQVSQDSPERVAAENVTALRQKRSDATEAAVPATEQTETVPSDEDVIDADEVDVDLEADADEGFPADEEDAALTPVDLDTETGTEPDPDTDTDTNTDTDTDTDTGASRSGDEGSDQENKAA